MTTKRQGGFRFTDPHDDDETDDWHAMPHREPPARRDMAIHVRMRKRMRTQTIAIVAAAVVLVGCVGKITTTYPDGTTVEVVQPGKAVSPATLNQTRQGTDYTLAMSTGSRQPRDPTADRQTGILTWVGVGLMALGVATAIARAWFPLIPLAASVGVAAFGLFLVVLPQLLTKLTSWPALIAGAILATVAAVYLIGWRLNRQAATPAPKDSSVASSPASP